MKLRHITALFLAIVMLLMTLTACFGELTTGAETTTDETPSTTTGKVPGTTKPTPGTTKPPQSGETPENGDWLTGYLEKMPTFTINTENNAPIVSKEIYLNGEITIDSSEEAYNMDKAVIEIRGRGNYTWTGTEKKSYRIKFAEKTIL